MGILETAGTCPQTSRGRVNGGWENVVNGAQTPTSRPWTARMPAIDLVILDCDGTLMDSERIAAEVESAMLAECGVTISPEEYERRFAGTSSEQAFREVEKEAGRALPEDYLARVDAEILRRFRTEVKSVPGAHDILDRFDQPRCVCSNSSMAKLEAELRRANLWDRFRPYIFSAHDLPDCEEKPAPDVFLHACREFGVEPRRAIVLEDSVSGVTAARAAGCRTVGFSGTARSKSHADLLTEAGAETVIFRLGDFPELIEVFGAWEGLDA